MDFYSLTKRFHSQKNIEVWFLKLDQRVSRASYLKILEIVKKFGGYKVSGGFTFEQDPSSFLEKMAGEIKQVIEQESVADLPQGPWLEPHPFTKPQEEEFNRYTHFPSDLNDRFQKELQPTEERLLHFFRVQTLKEIPVPILEAYYKLRKAIYEYYLAKSRARAIAPPTSVVGPAKYKGNPERARAIERNAYEYVNWAQGNLDKLLKRLWKANRPKPNPVINFETISTEINACFKDARKKYPFSIIQSAKGSEKGIRWRLYNVFYEKGGFHADTQIMITEMGSVSMRGQRVSTFNSSEDLCHSIDIALGFFAKSAKSDYDNFLLRSFKFPSPQIAERFIRIYERDGKRAHSSEGVYSPEFIMWVLSGVGSASGSGDVFERIEKEMQQVKASLPPIARATVENKWKALKQIIQGKFIQSKVDPSPSNIRHEILLVLEKWNIKIEPRVSMKDFSLEEYSAYFDGFFRQRWGLDCFDIEEAYIKNGHSTFILRIYGIIMPELFEQFYQRFDNAIIQQPYAGNIKEINVESNKEIFDKTNRPCYDLVFKFNVEVSSIPIWSPVDETVWNYYRKELWGQKKGIAWRELIIPLPDASPVKGEQIHDFSRVKNQIDAFLPHFKEEQKVTILETATGRNQKEGTWVLYYLRLLDKEYGYDLYLNSLMEFECKRFLSKELIYSEESLANFEVGFNDVLGIFHRPKESLYNLPLEEAESKVKEYLEQAIGEDHFEITDSYSRHSDDLFAESPEGLASIDITFSEIDMETIYRLLFNQFSGFDIEVPYNGYDDEEAIEQLAKDFQKTGRHSYDLMIISREAGEYSGWTTQKNTIWEILKESAWKDAKKDGEPKLREIVDYLAKNGVEYNSDWPLDWVNDVVRAGKNCIEIRYNPFKQAIKPLLEKRYPEIIFTDEIRGKEDPWCRICLPEEKEADAKKTKVGSFQIDSELLIALTEFRQTFANLLTEGDISGIGVGLIGAKEGILVTIESELPPALKKVFPSTFKGFPVGIFVTGKISPLKVEILRREGTIGKLSNGKEGIRVTLQIKEYSPPNPKLLFDEFSKIEKVISPKGAEIDLNSISASGQTVNAILPIERYSEIHQILLEMEVRVDIARNYNLTLPVDGKQSSHKDKTKEEKEAEIEALDAFLKDYNEGDLYKQDIYLTMGDCVNFAVAMAELLQTKEGYECGYQTFRNIENNKERESLHHCAFFFNGQLFDAEGKTNEDEIRGTGPEMHGKSGEAFDETEEEFLDDYVGGVSAIAIPKEEPLFFNLVDREKVEKIKQDVKEHYNHWVEQADESSQIDSKKDRKAKGSDMSLETLERLTNQVFDFLKKSIKKQDPNLELEDYEDHPDYDDERDILYPDHRIILPTGNARITIMRTPPIPFGGHLILEIEFLEDIKNTVFGNYEEPPIQSYLKDLPAKTRKQITKEKLAERLFNEAIVNFEETVILLSDLLSYVKPLGIESVNVCDFSGEYSRDIE